MGNTKYLGTSKQENTTHQSLRNAATAVLRGKFITSVYVIKERPSVNQLMISLQGTAHSQQREELKHRGRNKTEARKAIGKIGKLKQDVNLLLMTSGVSGRAGVA